jgi:hypothetical protein
MIRIFDGAYFFLLLIFCTTLTAYAEDFCFLALSDLHLDPTLTSRMPLAPASKGSDMDSNTFKQFSKAIVHTGAYKQSEILLVLGDLVGHGLSNKMRQSVFKQVVSGFAELNKPSYFIFGNNDSPQGNYQAYEGKNGSPYKFVKSLFPKVVSGFSTSNILNWCSLSSNLPCLIDEDSIKGVFTIKLKEGLWMIAINSVVFDGDYLHIFQGDAKFVLHWLDDQLQKSAAANTQTILAMHVPPIINLHSKHYHFRDKHTLEPTFYNAFIDILKNRTVEDGARIILILGGHTHTDELHLISVNQQVIPVSIIPGLSTSHGNAAGFKEICLKQVMGHWEIQDVIAYRYFGSEFGFRSYQSIMTDLCLTDQSVSKCIKQVISHPNRLVDYIEKNYFAANPNRKTISHIKPRDLVKKIY